jgi:hypothetical protein
MSTSKTQPLNDLHTLQVLSREQVLEAVDLTEETVDVPEWGGAVKVRGFSKGEQMEMRKEATVDTKIDTDRLEILMFVHGVSEPKFTADDMAALRQKAAGAVDRVLKRITILSGISEEAVAEAEKQFRK